VMSVEDGCIDPQENFGGVVGVNTAECDQQEKYCYVK
jgi:hypothetical protein